LDVLATVKVVGAAEEAVIVNVSYLKNKLGRTCEMRKLVTLFFALGAVCFVQAAEQRTYTKSPLLGDTSSFKQDKTDKTMRVYRQKGKKAKDYMKFIVDPVLIYPSTHRGGEKLSPENLQKLAELFQGLLLETLKDGYDVTQAPGPDTLRFRFGIRDMKPGRYFMDGAGVHQIKADTDLAAVTFEMEGIDSLTGERIVAVVREVNNDEVQGSDRQKQVQRVQDVFAEWVRVLRNRLDEANIPQ